MIDQKYDELYSVCEKADAFGLREVTDMDRKKKGIFAGVIAIVLAAAGAAAAFVRSKQDR